MTTHHVALSDALGHVTQTPSPHQILMTEWEAGTEIVSVVNERIASVVGGAKELSAAIMEHLMVYLCGLDGANFGAWHQKFGAGYAFIKPVEVTLGYVTIPDKPHLMRLWGADEKLIAKVTSTDYNLLTDFYNKFQQAAGELGFIVVSRGFGPRGLLTSIFS